MPIGLLRGTDERVYARAISYPQVGKLSKADEPQVALRHDAVGRKREYYHIFIFPDKTKFYIKKEEDK